MVGTRKLASLADHTAAAGTKLELIGDPGQLPEIEAGGTFRGLRARLGATHLVENRRQIEPWERTALAELRHGDTDQALDAYLDHQRIHHAADDIDARDELVQEWMNARAEGHDVLMVAARLRDVDDLNRRARQLLRDEGHLDNDQVILAGRGFAEGDAVLALRNAYRLGVLNGTRGVITGIDHTRRSFLVAADGHEQLRIPFGYVEAGHLTHGYATTIHKAQGLTVDRCLVLLDDTLAREHTYTALSRGRHGNDGYLAAPERRVEDRHTAEIEPDPLEGLRAAVGRSAAKRLALDHSGTPPSTPTVEMRRERDELQAGLGIGPPDPSWEFRHLAERRRREEHYLEDARWRRAVAQRDLDDLGPISRRVRRAQRRDIEDRINRSATEVNQHETTISRIDDELAAVAPALATRTEWERDHGAELHGIDTLERCIDMADRLEQAAEIGREQALERKLGLEW